MLALSKKFPSAFQQQDLVESLTNKPKAFQLLATGDLMVVQDIMKRVEGLNQDKLVF